MQSERATHDAALRQTVGSPVLNEEAVGFELFEASQASAPSEKNFHSLVPATDPFGDFDILCASSRAGYTITNVPVHYTARTYGTTQVGKVYNGLILLKLCAAYLWQRLTSLKKQQTHS